MEEYDRPMKKENKLYRPYILTTPEDSLPFMLVKPKSKEFDKLVMEHYINFVAFDFRDNSSDGFWLRFKDFDQRLVMDDFTTSHIPMETWKKASNRILSVINYIDDGFIVACDYNKRYIKKMEYDYDREHCLIVYGYDTDHEILRCKEFFEGNLISFECPFLEFEEAITNYPWIDKTNTGLFAIKKHSIADSEQISYVHLYNELHEFVNMKYFEYRNGIKTYGISALNTFLNGIRYYSEWQEKQYRIFYWLNYVYSSCKLLDYRITHVSHSKYKSYVRSESTVLFYSLFEEIRLIFYRILKFRTDGNDYMNDFEDLWKKCCEITSLYAKFMDEFVKDVCLIAEKQSEEIESEDMYWFTKRYLRNW